MENATQSQFVRRSFFVCDPDLSTEQFRQAFPGEAARHDAPATKNQPQSSFCGSKQPWQVVVLNLMIDDKLASGSINR